MDGADTFLSGSYTKRRALPKRPRSGPTGYSEGSGRRIAFRSGAELTELSQRAPGLANHLSLELEESDLLAAELVAEARPDALRPFDQISMLAGDLALQAKLVRPMLAGKRVAFMGDNDGASLVLGLMGVFGAEPPEHMLLLDFDRRVLARAMALALRHGFADRFEGRAYNAFDVVPKDLLGQFDVFYTNPPYGRANVGESARLFITRGMELCHSRGGASGCVILPDDTERLWTRQAMRASQAFILARGWEVQEKINSLHRYHLLSDPGLTSGMLWVSDVEAGRGLPTAPYTGRCVSPEEIVHFYGTKVISPYPRYIRENGEHDCEWTRG